MDVTMIITALSAWIAYMFPSMAQYTKYMGPGLMMVISGIGIFTNWLPAPKHVYPVPDTLQLQVELQGSGGFILKIAKFTRSVVIGVNWFLATAIYAWFFNTTNKVSAVLSKVKLAPKPAVTA